MTPSRNVAAAPQSGWDRLRLGIFLGFLALVFVGGGASRLDVASLLYLRPAAVLCAVALLLIPGRLDFARVRAPLLFLGALALIMAIQLIPLPPGVWTALPGHGRFAEAAAAAGIDQPWRPISLSPDLTLNSLVALIVPAAVLIGMAGIADARAERWLLVFLAGAAVLSAVLGIAQISGGAGSGLYLYRITNEGMPVGFFANRNHQAALLAAAFPMLAAWSAGRSGDPRTDMARRWVAGIVGAMLIPLIVVTGSRAGVILAIVGVGSAAAIYRVSRSARPGRPTARDRAIALAPWLIGFAMLLIALFAARISAVQRLFAGGVREDQRFEDFGLFVEMTKDFFPFGSGFGTFDPIFRVYEPYEHLRLVYLNHAHNDVMELLITAGAFGLLLALAFLAWYALRLVVLLRAEGRSSKALPILGAAIVAILLGASVTDYPLRVPIMMALFAIASVWIGSGGLPQPAEPRRERP